MQKSLAQILDVTSTRDIVEIRGNLDGIIYAPIVENVDELHEGGVFVARRGSKFDGHDFIQNAIHKGAAAIIGENQLPHINVPYVQMKNLQEQIGLLAAEYYDWPAKKLTLFGITGTDGKTTTTHLLYQILQRKYPGKVGLVSTLMAFYGDEEEETGLHVTSPPAPQLQFYLNRMVECGLTHAVIEMTSHGLSQGRVQGVNLASAMITNIQHEHLDFHGSWEDYRMSKGLIFSYMTHPNGLRVINADDFGSQIYCKQRYTSFGHSDDAEFQIYCVKETAIGIDFQLKMPTTTLNILTPLHGRYNAANCAAAAAAAYTFVNRDSDAIRDGIADLHYLPGRMEPIEESQDFRAFVDFAHTPAALKEALMSSRKKLIGKQRLCVVFGSAGLRDVAKRQMMSEIAVELADYVVLTAEDPRTESLERILHHMAEACRKHGGEEGTDFVCIKDRGEALLHACHWAQKDDIVIACGKGHEQSMCFGTIEYPWDDRMALRAAINGKNISKLPTANI